jgi:type IV pilus assembly protein PilQ
MSYQPRINTATPRTALVLLVLCALGTNGLAASRNPSAIAGITATTRGLIATAVESTGSQDPMVQQSQASPSATPRASIAPSADGVSQRAQGRQYGQPGFVGEPINLNVVNADIRDILNYITEQYSVNFVIDSSVGAVPVTVNVQEVPWNIALDAVLKANRLGVEVSGNILRVATTTVLANESSIQQVLSNSRLDASPLVTEFIRLNYACGSASLCKAQGGDFVGGVTLISNAYVPAVGGGSSSDRQTLTTGGGGIQPIIQKRLSRRGSVEVDENTNTLIITDVKENIDAIRVLVKLLDQPEPQVEIETRIVIATRNFSRDLGAQLSAGVLNPSRGGLGNISTLPSTPPVSGTVPQGVFGGLVGTPQPFGTLGAAATTVIGLTTGIFGTAQISALITAAETKGTAKIVATPRVTVLNNRKAEISSGSQIPITTGQSGGSGGAVLFTTTFVSVPLRLAVTPRITDAGTVILHVLAENNSVNAAIAIGGTPGIDTQKMETFVLVPDGGTTIVGGVLGENDSTTKVRTPGLANVPILGNLFKRKTVTKLSSEILFFITPRIYRPDYNGRPTTSVVGTGNRSTTISQPVSLGNPQSNTPSDQPQTQQQSPMQVVPLVPATPIP